MVQEVETDGVVIIKVDNNASDVSCGIIMLGVHDGSLFSVGS